MKTKTRGGNPGLLQPRSKFKSTSACKVVSFRPRVDVSPELSASLDRLSEVGFRARFALDDLVNFGDEVDGNGIDLLSIAVLATLERHGDERAKEYAEAIRRAWLRIYPRPNIGTEPPVGSGDGSTK